MAEPTQTEEQKKEMLINILRALSPYLAPDQREAISQQHGFAPPSNVNYPLVPDARTSRYAYSAERAMQALKALNALDETTKGTAGYKFLERSIGLAKDYGAKDKYSGIKRSSLARLRNSFQELQKAAVMSKTDVTPYNDVADAFVAPKFGTESVTQNRKVGNNTIYGSPNSKLFT